MADILFRNEYYLRFFVALRLVVLRFAVLRAGLRLAALRFFAFGIKCTSSLKKVRRNSLQI